MKFSSFLLPVVFFLLSFILLILPGNAFPKNDLFKIPGLDKIIHTGMFFLLTVLFAYPLHHSTLNKQQRSLYLLQVAVAAFVYGFIMEFVQKYLVANRSFEMADILFDGIGVLSGWIVSKRLFIQDKPVVKK